MNRLGGPKKLAFIATAALAIVLAIDVPSHARAGGGHGLGGGHPGGAAGHGFVGHRGFDGHHGVVGHRFGGRRFEHRHFGFVPFVPFYGYYPGDAYPPAFGEQAPTYWYYCPSYGAYYPDVQSCPEDWVPVPGS